MARKPLPMEIIGKSNSGATPASLSGFFALACCLPILAGCSTSGVSIRYFDVPGGSFKQVAHHVRRTNSAVRVSTAMDYRFETEQSGEMCRIKNVEMKSDVSIELPRWTDLDKADRDDRELLQAISKYYDVLAKQRINIYQAHRQKIINEMKAIKPQPTCEMVVRKAKWAFNEGVVKHDKDQRAFGQKKNAEFKKQFRSL